MADFFGQALRQLQYTALLDNIDVSMPEPLQQFFDIFNVLTLDVRRLIGDAALPEITFRILFLFVACCLTVLIAVLFLLMSQAWFIVTWYLMLVGGACLMLVGILGVAIPGITPVNAEVSETLAIAGGTIVGAAIGLYAIRYAHRSLFPEATRKIYGHAELDNYLKELDENNNKPNNENSDDELDEILDETRASSVIDMNNNSFFSPDDDLAATNTSGQRSRGGSFAAARSSSPSPDNSSSLTWMKNSKKNKKKKKKLSTAKKLFKIETEDGSLEVDLQTAINHYERLDALRFHRTRLMQHIAMTFVLSFIGLLFTGIISISAPGVSSTTNEYFSNSIYYLNIGYAFLGCGAFSLFWMTVNLFQCGRAATYDFLGLVQQEMLRLLILVVLFAFIPVVSYCVDSFVCVEYTCPAGSVFNPFANRPKGSYSLDPFYFCDRCNFYVNNTNTSSNNNTTITGQDQCTSSFKQQHCPAFSQKRLMSDPAALCDDSGYVVLVIAAVIILVSFTIGIPRVYYKVTEYLATEIGMKIKVPEDKLKKIVKDLLLKLGCDTEDVNHKNNHEDGLDSSMDSPDTQRQHRENPTENNEPISATSNGPISANTNNNNNQNNLNNDDDDATNDNPNSTSTVDLLKRFLAELDEFGDGTLFVTVEDRREYLWSRQQAAADTVFGSIFSPYKHRTMHYLLIDMVQRFLFVLILQIIAPFAAGASAIIVLICHVVVTVVLFYFSPYSDFKLQWYASALSCANVLNSILVVVLWARGGAEGFLEYAYVILGINALISVIGGLVLAYLRWKAQKANKEVQRTETEEKTKRLIELLDEIRQREETPSSFIHEIEITEDQIMSAMEADKAANQKLSNTLNTHTNEMMTKNFMIIGFFGCIATALAILAILLEAPSPFRFASSLIYPNIEQQIGGFTSWDNFTKNCCCSPGTANFNDYNITESWVCNNGVSVTRARQTSDGRSENNGLLIRSLCNTTFNFGCSGVVKNGQLVLTCPEEGEEKLKELGVSDTAKLLYL